MSASAPIPSLLLALLLCAAPGRAPGDSWWDQDLSYDRARRATERGEILPLAGIYQRVSAQVPGRVVATKPFRVEELLARLRAIMRRGTGQRAAVLRAGGLSLDTRQMRG